MRSDPPSVEITLLWLYTLLVNEAGVHAPCIEGETIAQERISLVGDA